MHTHAHVPLCPPPLPQLWMGRSVLSVVLHVQRQVFKAIGWLAGREEAVCKVSHFYFGADVKRWHLGLGGCLVVVVAGLLGVLGGTLEPVLRAGASMS